MKRFKEILFDILYMYLVWGVPSTLIYIIVDNESLWYGHGILGYILMSCVLFVLTVIIYTIVYHSLTFLFKSIGCEKYLEYEVIKE